MQLRSATPNDAPALGALHVASWRETYMGLVPDTMLSGLSVDARTMMWEKILSDPGSFAEADVYVAEDDDGIAGFGSCSQQRDQTLSNAGFDGEISALYVLRSHQQRGVGRGLMREMAAALRRRDRTSASLWVLRDNMPARRFYERLGGAIVGEKKDERPNTTLVEVAYGWPDLSHLVRC